MGSVGISLADGRIAAGVRSALANDPELGLRDIAVESDDGVVSLAGVVRTADEAARAATLAQAVPGVRHVKSALTISGASP